MLRVCGIGTALPDQSIGQAEAAELAKAFSGLSAEAVVALPLLYQRTRIQRRGSVVLDGPTRSDGGSRQSFFPLPQMPQDRGPTTDQRMRRYQQEAAPLAIRAMRAALDQAGVRPDRLDHLVTVSCTGFRAPGVDLALMRQLGMRPEISRTHIGFMGCAAALNGLRVASALAGGRSDCVVGVCAVELCSLHYQYGADPEQWVANALFADGAAAVVAAGTAAPEATAWSLAANGSCVFPDSADAISWDIGDHGFEMRLSMRVPGLLAQQLRPWLAEWLAQSQLTIESVASWAVHPGGPRILSSVRDALGLPSSALAISSAVLERCGNMSSPTLLFILDRLRQERAPRPCVALAFGPGVTVEAALFL